MTLDAGVAIIFVLVVIVIALLALIRPENRGDSIPLKEDGVHDRHQCSPKLPSLST